MCCDMQGSPLSTPNSERKQFTPRNLRNFALRLFVVFESWTGRKQNSQKHAWYLVTTVCSNCLYGISWCVRQFNSNRSQFALRWSVSHSFSCRSQFAFKRSHSDRFWLTSISDRCNTRRHWRERLLIYSNRVLYLKIILISQQFVVWFQTACQDPKGSLKWGVLNINIIYWLDIKRFIYSFARFENNQTCLPISLKNSAVTSRRKTSALALSPTKSQQLGENVLSG